MSARSNLREIQRRAGEGPIVPDSTLYRVLQHVARSIANRLRADDGRTRQENVIEYHTESNREAE
jgi:hypothetical protein